MKGNEGGVDLGGWAVEWEDGGGVGWEEQKEGRMVRDVLCERRIFLKKLRIYS